MVPETSTKTIYSSTSESMTSSEATSSDDNRRIGNLMFILAPFYFWLRWIGFSLRGSL